MPEWLSSKRTHITSDGDDVGKRKPLVKMETGAATVENLHCMKVSQKTNNRITLRSSSSTTEYILKKKKPKTLIQKYMGIPIFITELFIIAKVRKQAVLSTDKRVKKMWNGILLSHEQNEMVAVWSSTPS